MQTVMLEGFQWPNIWLFLAGPVAILIFLWAVLDGHARRKWSGVVFSSILALVFLVTASSVEYRDLQFNKSISELDIQSAYDRSIEKAETKGQPVLFYFHADWCTNCDDLKRRLQRKDIHDRLQSFILVAMDVTREEEYAKAQSIFGLDVVPSLAFASSDGKPLPVLLRGVSFPESALLGVLDRLE